MTTTMSKDGSAKNDHVGSWWTRLKKRLFSGDATLLTLCVWFGVLLSFNVLATLWWSHEVCGNWWGVPRFLWDPSACKPAEYLRWWGLVSFVIDVAWVGLTATLLLRAYRWLLTVAPWVAAGLGLPTALWLLSEAAEFIGALLRLFGTTPPDSQTLALWTSLKWGGVVLTVAALLCLVGVWLQQDAKEVDRQEREQARRAASANRGPALTS
jgi:hypothetical protein